MRIIAAMPDLYKQSVLAQFEAALWMLHDCIHKCPDEHWSGATAIIGKYEFWHVVHHTLACTDGYLSSNEESMEYLPEFYPAGHRDIDEEYPSRTFSKDEMLTFIAHCLTKLRESIANETEESLRGPSGFSWVEINRAELHLYSLRHVMHHTGMLSAFLRRLDPPKDRQPRWGFTGWRD